MANNILVHRLMVILTQQLDAHSMSTSICILVRVWIASWWYSIKTENTYVASYLALAAVETLVLFADPFHVPSHLTTFASPRSHRLHSYVGQALFQLISTSCTRYRRQWSSSRQSIESNSVKSQAASKPRKLQRKKSSKVWCCTIVE
jgi:hypothetical protein